MDRGFIWQKVRSSLTKVQSNGYVLFFLAVDIEMNGCGRSRGSGRWPAVFFIAAPCLTGQLLAGVDGFDVLVHRSSIREHKKQEELKGISPRDFSRSGSAQGTRATR